MFFYKPDPSLHFQAFVLYLCNLSVCVCSFKMLIFSMGFQTGLGITNVFFLDQVNTERLIAYLVVCLDYLEINGNRVDLERPDASEGISE